MKKVLSLLILVILIAGCSIKPEESCMAVEFDGTNGQGIQYSSIPSVDNLATKTISFWTYIDTDGDVDTFIDKSDAATTGWYVDENADATGGKGKIRFAELFDDSGVVLGSWYTDDDYANSQWIHVAITYDNTNVANNPIIYIDKVAVAITEGGTPSGSVAAETNGLEIGYASELAISTIIGKIEDPRIFNVILTPTEIAEIANSRCQRTITRGLVFAPFLDGAAGLSSFDGISLAEANTIVDSISGAVGIPYGSPVGRANTIQRIY